MAEPFLYERLDAASSMGFLKREVPDNVAQNLNPKYELRPYQVEAFARFLYCYKNDFPNKAYPLFLFNMATGSGKTLIITNSLMVLRQSISPASASRTSRLCSGPFDFLTNSASAPLLIWG